MFFLNMGVMEFGALLAALASFVTALYLLDRTRRKRIVSTLRFWTAGAIAQQKRRRRVQEPWSLALQLASLLLLLLAVAQLQFGSRARRGRDHVVLLDTSAWSAQLRGSRTLLDDEKQAAEQYASAVPARDRILLVAADALATPLTPFTSDRASLRTAIRALRSSFSGLNLEQALLFARSAQNGSDGEPGEVAYIGPGMMTRNELGLPQIQHLRIVRVAADRQHTGVRGVSVQPSMSDATAWRATVTVKNYGLRPASLLLRVVAGPSFARRVLSLGAGEEASAEFRLATNTAREFVAEVDGGSGLDGDHHVALDLPPLAKARVVVVTSRADMLRPLFPANSHLEVRFLAPDQYRPSADTNLTVFDQTAALMPGAGAAMWIDPPPDRAPWPLKTTVEQARITAWRSETPLAAGLRTKQTPLGKATVFQTFDGDTVVASADAGPVVVARDGGRDQQKRAVIGFDPLNGRTRFELTTPLLFANLLRWSLPDVFQTSDITAERVGTVTIPLEPGQGGDGVRVQDQQGKPVPFLATRKSVEVFVGHPQVLQLIAGDRQRTLSVVLPDVAQFAWTPAHAANGLPGPARLTPRTIDLWRFLAVLGALGLLAEWLLFGRQRKREPLVPVAGSPTRGAHERELVAR
jgi:von Willebrand factor type A domain/Aerotolerance regulator N-terminal